MTPVLLLTHRIPYPPNKGDKIRSYHLLRHLAERYRVVLGTFVDDPADRPHLEALRALCAEVCAVDLDPRVATVLSARGFLTGEALTLPYYRSDRLQAWVDDVIKRLALSRAVVFSSPMTQYIRRHPDLRVVADYCDVDSAKWTQYAEGRRWPNSAIYRREGVHLLAFEKEMAERVAACTLATEAEAALFRRLARPRHANLHVVANGVDTDFFATDRARASPFPATDLPIVFTGAMDYWPNVDAVAWFTANVLPEVRRRHPAARFYVVGMNPAPAVQALAGASVSVTGRVPDVRPYLQHARVVVIPLRIARGVQNKALEAMSMGRTVVMTRAVASGVTGVPGRDFRVADGESALAEEISRVLAMGGDPEMERRARERVVADFNWARNLSRITDLLEDVAPVPSIASREAHP